MREGQLLWWLSETGEGGAERGFVRLWEVVWVRGMLSLLSWEGGEAKRVFLCNCLLQHGSVERITGTRPGLYPSFGIHTGTLTRVLDSLA